MDPLTRGHPASLRTRRGLAALVFVLASSMASPPVEASEEGEILLTWSPADVVLTPEGGETVVGLRGALTGASAPGTPELPSLSVFVQGPGAATVGKVEVEIVDTVALGVHRVRTARPDTPVDREPAAAVALEAEIAASAEPYPREVARFAGRGALRGQELLCFEVRPLRWRPQSGELELVSVLRVKYELVPAAGLALPRHRVVETTEARFARGLDRVLQSKGLKGLTSAAPAAGAGAMPAGPGPYQPTFRPTTDGSAVEYVIVTSEALAGAFQPLADWKTHKGVQAVVRTTEWIDQTYPNGVDRAERIRFFIRDAYQNWGTLFVLLGGDTEIVPPRYGITTLIGGEAIPADYYYMCLEGNWNGDGDARFGEGYVSLESPGDGADLLPEVYVGRASVSTFVSAQAVVAKTIAYDSSPAGGNGYPASILYLAERLFSNYDGAVLAELADDIVPAWFKRVKLYEEYPNWPGSLPETLESVTDSTNNGFGIIHHVGHGHRNTMSVGEGSMSNADVDVLANGPRQSVVFGVNCSSASIDFNSIGERWLKNPNGGAIAYIGTSRFAFVNSSRDYQQEWFSVIFDDSLRSVGEASALARLPFVFLSEWDSAMRWTLFAVTLIGDPELDVMTNAVIPMNVAHPASYVLGSGAFTATVTSGGSPVAGATVTLWKAEQAYARGVTAADGGVTFASFPAETPGTATLTVHKTYYRPYQAPVNIMGTVGSHLYVVATQVDDDSSGGSSGDGDGLADAGETIQLGVTLHNGGGGAATGVTASLSAEDPSGFLNITTANVAYGTINAGGSNAGSGWFVIEIDRDAPEAFQPLLTLAISSNQGQSSDVFVLPVRRPYLEHYEHLIDDAPPRGNGNGRVEELEEIWYTISLRNAGQETGFGVNATLAAVRADDHQPQPLVTVTDGASIFGNIAVGATVPGDRFVFAFPVKVSPAETQLEVSYTDAQGPVRVEFLDLTPPAAPESLLAYGSPSSILLKWKRPADADLKGYDIYRSANQGGPFLRVNTYSADGSAVYEDGGLPALSRYYYRVVARDTSFNSGPFSPVFSGTTNPPLASGWPIELGQQSLSSLQLANTAGGSDNELFTGADYQYGWHASGVEIVDGDDDPRTLGVYALDGWNASRGFAATPALGDMDGDGDVEVANVGWTIPNAYVWDNQGVLMPGWPRPVLGDFNWASPLMTDLDLDGDLELVVWAANGGNLFAWHHDGAEVADGDQNPSTQGVLKHISGVSFNYSSPAAANLDGDPEPEIVFCANFSSDQSGGIYAVNADGSWVSGWPVFTGESSIPSFITASPAIGDVDQDGTNEIVVASERSGGTVHLLRNNGTSMPGWPIQVPAVSMQARTASPVLADLDGDTYLDVIFPGSNGELWVWSRTGVIHPGFPISYYTRPGEATEGSPAVGDVDGDGEMEILIGDESGLLHAFNRDGTPVNGFPIQLNGEIRSSPIIWDIDNDSLIEVGVSGWDSNVYVWDLPFEWNPIRIGWPFFRHDSANTGYVGTDVMPIAVGDPGSAGGTLPRWVAVHPARPNPFNPRTTIAFDVPGPGPVPVTLTIYDLGGRVVARLVDDELPAGSHAIEWDGRGAAGEALGSGVYFYRMSIGEFVASRKLTLVK